jgi:hypothetical protein
MWLMTAHYGGLLALVGFLGKYLIDSYVKWAGALNGAVNRAVIKPTPKLMKLTSQSPSGLAQLTTD